MRLNWLDINGTGLGVNGIRIVNGNVAGTSVVVENTNIDGFTVRGISDERINGGKLVVSNTVIRHTVGSGIQIAAGGNKIDATISNVRVHNSATAGLTANGGAKVMISNSVFSRSTFGLDISQANTEATADNVTLSGNTTGMLVGGRRDAEAFELERVVQRHRRERNRPVIQQQSVRQQRRGGNDHADRQPLESDRPAVGPVRIQVDRSVLARLSRQAGETCA